MSKLDPEYVSQLQRGNVLTTKMLSGATHEERLEAAREAGIASEEDPKDPAAALETILKIGVVRSVDGIFWVQLQGSKDPLCALQLDDAAQLQAMLFNALTLAFSPHMTQDEHTAHMAEIA